MRRLPLLFALAALGGCVPALRVPVPVVGPHVNEQPLIVPYPPPAARVEVITKRPAVKNILWIDGEWQWRGRRWVWQRGRWEVQAAGTYWAPAVTLRQQDGLLVFFRGGWRLENGGKQLPEKVQQAQTWNGDGSPNKIKPPG